MANNTPTMLKGQSLVLQPQWDSFFDTDSKVRLREMEERGILQPFSSPVEVGGEIKVYSQGMLDFAKTCIEKNISANDIETNDLIAEITISQEPIWDKTALRRFLLARDKGVEENREETIITDIVVGEVEETDIGNVPSDQISLLEEETLLPENNENNITSNATNSVRVVTRSEDVTLCSLLGLDETVFSEIFQQMKNNFSFAGVEYGKMSTKAKANLMAAGTIPKFKNFRVATGEELDLYIIATEGTYDLPEGIIETIKERCAERSKKTTGKWARKKANETADIPPAETDTVEETLIVEPTFVELKTAVIDRVNALEETTDNTTIIQQLLSILS